MKKIYFLVVCVAFLGLTTNLFAQGADCANADPFCTDNNYTFPASVNTDAEIGPDYGCLGSQPNPAWYYIQVANSGNIVIDLGSTNGADDIDFICWGPFNNLGTACSNLTGGGAFSGCTLFGTYPCGNIVDCSYSINPTETCTINGAVAGQYYMFLITNFENTPTDIFANTNPSSTGSTNCAIVPPPVGSCIINSFSYNISACAANNTFTIDGDFQYTDNPGAGTLVVEIDNGTNVYTQTFNPPFVDGQTYTYSIPNIPADGAASTITVYFTADPTCNQTANYTAVSDCSCAADIGTFNQSIVGQSTTNYVLCYGDVLNINSNNDNTPPGEALNPPPAFPYDPGIGWLVFSCPPTVGITPSATEDIANDPCLQGVYMFDDFTDMNDLFWINNNPGVFTDNTVYFVPITFYSMSDGYYSYVNTSIPCYDLGPTYAVQYLPEVTFTQTTDCATGEATATLNGGLPAVNAANVFTAVAGSLTPATASFVNTTCGDGGTIVVSGLTSGQAYSFDVNDGNGCLITVTGTMAGSGGATLTYPQNAYCQDATDPSPTVTGNVGGTFSSTAGLVINGSSGVIDLSASTPGLYTVTYLGVGGACPPSATFNITVNALPVIVGGADQTVCQGTQVTLNATGAPTITWDNGVTNNVPFTPAATLSYTATGTSAAGCVATDVVLVTVQPTTPPVFTVSDNSGCSPFTVTFTNTSGGTDCTWQFSDGTTGTGCATITHTFVNVGCYDVTLTTETAIGCTATTTQNNFVCVVPNPNAIFTPNPSLLTTMDATSQMINNSTNATTYAWDFGDGTVSSTVSPTHAFPSDVPGSYVVELIAISPEGCRDTAYATVVVQEELIFYVPNSFTPDGDEFNQTFQPVFTSGFDPFDFNMLIFDRWGEVIFETNNAEFGWDGSYHGKIVKEGTYSWKIEFKTSKSDARKVVVGHVNVLR
ncbi:MAG: gliding motility-associated C-terminal domain-containing protein [Fluviicola sp.]|nr:gliding motility-associated C-terminal domain-containing protein [Fluviicola sp.]